MVRQTLRKSATAPPAVQTNRVQQTVATKANGVHVKAVAGSKSKVEVTSKAPSKRKSTAGEDEDFENHIPAEEEKPAKKPKTKTGEEKNMPLAERTAVSSLKKAMYIGAHISSAGGVQNSVQNAVNIGANAFALFLKSQRKWASPPLATDAKDQFHNQSKQHGYNAGRHVLPHGSYLVNLAQSDEEKAAQAYANFLDDLNRCEALGIRLYNFHPGSTGGDTKAAAIGRIAAQLNRSHKATSTVVTVVESMCGSGNVVGSTFEELRDIIALVEDKSRVGVCIDTCHTFAAGYDLRTPEAFAKTMNEFDKVVGMKFLKALHINDSKTPLGSHRDVHANIGTGFLGLRAFHNVMNFEPFQNMPLVLETPIDRQGPDGKTIEDKQVWADEIKLLEGLVGADPDSADFKSQEKDLQAKGAGERKKFQEQADRKQAKDSKGPAKGQKKLDNFFAKGSQ